MALAVIFDLDGCLADSEPLSLEAVAAEMRGLGIEDARADRIRHEFLGVTIGAICAWVSVSARVGPTASMLAVSSKNRVNLAT